MSNIDKHAVQAVADLKAGYTLGHADVAILNELARIALASLEAEAVGEVVLGEFDDCGCHPDARVECIAADGQADWENFKDGTRLYTAPTVPVSVPDAMEMDDDFDSAFEHGKAVGWNAYRAAMLQGANGTLTNEGTITATQFKPVADLYEVTVPSGRSTTFTKDAAEASDCRVMGWSVQEYVKLERYQAAMLQGVENAESPTTMQTAPSLDSSQIIAESPSGNSPVIPDCSCGTCRPVTFTDSRFVVCSECGNKRCPHANDHRNACTGSNEPGQKGSAYPAAPQQEVTQALAKGMERYGDAMQELAKKEVK
ncbi:hypothetical protein [Enterobacter hormaechei]|uniref:hypothetical protein n=1 Tax=Enterobacter hormaechei TaxID=158836 RepID=UPI001E36C846|nr:hypothetical protein [Enterobacter hormaechei]MCC9359820.1 hypothetical protein [Enterobacter hormaechei subsp. xiangfangensis]